MGWKEKEHKTDGLWITDISNPYEAGEVRVNLRFVTKGTKNTTAHRVEAKLSVGQIARLVREARGIVDRQIESLQQQRRSLDG